MIGTLSSSDRQNLAKLCAGFYYRQEELVTQAVLGLCNHRNKDRNRLKSDLFRCMISYTHTPLGKINFESSLKDLLSVLKVNKVFIKPELLALVKTLITLQGVASGLDPDFSIVKMIENQKKLILSSYSKQLVWDIANKHIRQGE